MNGSTSLSSQHKSVTIGVEIEAYSINASDYRIGRHLARPRKGLSESGERFARDSSIGSEYNSRPFTTIREAFFLLKAGLRKYLRRLYRAKGPGSKHRVPLLVGGWTNRFAGTHLHVAFADQELTLEAATSLSRLIHDHLPFIIAICANSPIWDRTLTKNASNRLLKGSETYFLPLKRGVLTSESTHEMVYNPGRKTKPPTLEIRALDSNIPEFIVASACIVKAICLRWQKSKYATNALKNSDYFAARQAAGEKGMRAKLPWQGKLIPARTYVDRFLYEYREEFAMMDIPEDVYEVLRLLKCGYNCSKIIYDAAVVSRREHPQTWQRRFAKRYSHGLEHLLSGNSIRDFVAELKLELPATDSVWLGRRGASIG